MNKIILNDRNGSWIIDMKEIIYCEAQDCYSLFYLANGKKRVVSKTLKEFEDDLCRGTFVRVHRKYIVNMDHIRHIGKKLERCIVLSNNERLEVAVRRKKFFLRLFGRHLRKSEKRTLT